jgi:hypothetical protein
MLVTKKWTLQSPKLADEHGHIQNPCSWAILAGDWPGTDDLQSVAGSVGGIERSIEFRR